MRVMVDTNIRISMLLFPSRKYDEFFEIISGEHSLVLSSFVIDEFWDVIKRKFPQKEKAADSFLTKLSCELVYTPHQMPGNLLEIRDMKDYPVIYSAVMPKSFVSYRKPRRLSDEQREAARKRMNINKNFCRMGLIEVK